jgi:hypothetical protein
MKIFARRSSHSLITASAVALLLLGGGPVADAANFLINNTADTVDVHPGDGIAADANGNCTLRAAIMEAGALPGPHTLMLPAGTYTLSLPGRGEEAARSGDLDITNDVSIIGAGADVTVIDGGGIDRVFQVLPGAKLQLTKLTVQHGDPLNSGGGIWNKGSLVMTLCTLSGNTATDFGGGLVNDGTLTLTRTTVKANATLGSTTGGGGGIYSEGVATLTGCTFSGNTTLGRGGAFYNLDQTLTVINSTFSGNTALNGGGLFNRNGTVKLTYGTVALNQATDRAGGLWNFGGSLSLANTLISFNTAVNLSPNCDGSITSLGSNLSNDAGCGLNPGLGDLINTDPLLDPLADNGGPTETHALRAGSPAINAVPAAHLAASTDQRGAPRPQGANSDIGAYETGCALPPPNMVAWWPLDETAGTTAFELVGAHHGTALSGAIGSGSGPTPVAGQVDGALNLDGSTYYVSVPSAPALNFGTGDFSIDAWVNVHFPGSVNLHPIVHKLDWTQNKGYYFFLASASLNGAVLSLYLGDGSGPPAQYTTPVSTLVPYDTWTHVGVTVSRSSSTVTFFINGTAMALTAPAVPGGSLDNSAPLWIGASSQPGIGRKPVSVDEVELFNRALTPLDIQHVLAASTAGKCKCYQFGPPKLTCTLVNGLITLTWPGCCTLMQADQLTGPWTDVTGASSPYTLPPLSNQKFYRLWCN